MFQHSKAVFDAKYEDISHEKYIALKITFTIINSMRELFVNYNLKL